MATMAFNAIGTAWRIDIYDTLSSAAFERVQSAIRTRIEQFDATYSRFRADSVVSAMAEAPGTFTFPDDGAVLFTWYRSLYDITDGQLTPLIGGMLSDAGYDAAYSLKPTSIRPVPHWDEVMSVMGSVIKTSQPLQLDFGAAGKGYLVDIVSSLLGEQQVKEFTVDASGDMYHQAAQALPVGLEDPDDPTSAIGVIELQNRAVCGSAINRRAWGAYHHVMDPTRRHSTNTLKASWVVADTALQADGLATALFFVDANTLRPLATFESVTINQAGAATVSGELPGRLFGADS